MTIVYLSSTKEDLEDERAAVTDWLLKNHCEVRHSYRASPDPLVDACITVATVAPFDPATHTIEATLRGNSVLRLGSLVKRFLVTLDRQSELNLSSSACPRRWLRANIPDTLAGAASMALEERRTLFRREQGLA